MSIGRPRTYGVGDVAPDLGTLAGAHAVGADGFSGMVPAGSPLAHDPDAGRVDHLGDLEVHTAPTPSSDLNPIPGVVTRAMLGGIRTAPVYDGMMFAPDYDGAHMELRGRTSVVVLRPFEESAPMQDAGLPSLRVVPVSDPLGRMCANAAAAAGGVS
jgi:hypothetical protein